MKRILSLSLSVFLLFSLFMLPMNATEAEENLGKNTLYSIDFTEKYKELAPPADNEAKELENLGVTALKYQFADGTLGGGTYVASLTEGGLKLGSVYRCITGLVIKNTDFDFTKVNNYNIVIEMNESLSKLSGNSDYVYFGFGYTGSETTFNPTTANVNTRYNYSPAKFAIGGWTEDSTDNAIAIIEEMDKADSVVKYNLEVVNQMLKKIVVTCNDVTVTYTSATGISTATGDFTMLVRPNFNNNNPTVTVKSITIEEENVKMVGHQRTVVAEGKYGLRFVSVIDDISLYAEIGFDIVAKLPDNSEEIYGSKSSTVYKSITGTVDGTEVTYTAEELGGENIYCATMINIDSTIGIIIFTVTPYTISKSGTKTLYASMTVTYNGSTFVS